MKTRSIIRFCGCVVAAGALSLGAAGPISVAGQSSDEHMAGEETNYQIAEARCELAKRCWPDRSSAPCKNAENIKARWEAAKAKASHKTGTYRDDLRTCLAAVEKADCSKIPLDMIPFMTDASNKACAGYGDYYRHQGRYATK